MMMDTNKLYILTPDNVILTLIQPCVGLRKRNLLVLMI